MVSVRDVGDKVVDDEGAGVRGAGIETTAVVGMGIDREGVSTNNETGAAMDDGEGPIDNVVGDRVFDDEGSAGTETTEIGVVGTGVNREGGGAESKRRLKKKTEMFTLSVTLSDTRLKKERMTLVVWMTSLGLPIMQPYRKTQDLTFTSVHNSHWTHATTIDMMSKIIRDTFIDLHSSDILKKLDAEFCERYKDYKIPLVSLKNGSLLKGLHTLGSHIVGATCHVMSEDTKTTDIDKSEVTNVTNLRAKNAQAEAEGARHEDGEARDCRSNAEPKSKPEGMYWKGNKPYTTTIDLH
ncbi:hypothetical protein DXG01_016643 [Tephrocybe rancida]|nr:hypothetical protein DXG01_016643 [Tephrocybe rancida]